MSEPIRILHFVPILQAAGIENYIMNIYRAIDKSKVQFDFVVHSKTKSVYDDEVEKLGGKIYRFTYKDDKKFFKYVHDLNVFFKKHPEYKIIHGNMQSMMPVYLMIGKLNNVPVLIAHSHNSSYEKSLKGTLLHLLSRFTRFTSNVNFACSKEAAKYLFGDRKYEFSPNAIDVDKFSFSYNSREIVRKELNIDDNTIVVGHIGRFDIQKNHSRVIDIFYEFQQKNDNSILLLIGVGKLKEEIEKKVKSMNLQSKVKFLGLRNDTYKLYSGMDIFLFPSLYEGLPVTGIEAQATGLPCVFSSVITKEVNLTGLIHYVSLNETNSKWSKEMEDSKVELNKRSQYSGKLHDSRFNIVNNAKYMENWYISQWRNNTHE